jgi:hypothetical protein
MSQRRRASAIGKWSILVLGAGLALCVDLRASDQPAPASFRSAFEAQFPKTETSAAALEIERLATALVIQMAPFESPEAPADERSSGEKNVPVPFVLKPRKERPGPSPEQERSFFSAGASEFLNRELGVPDDRIGPPPPQLERFLADNESAVAAIESLLLREPEIRWEIDVTNYPNGPLPNLTGFMRLQRLLAARALVKGRAGETEAALRTIDAAWRLNEVLSSRPELISQLIVVAAAKIHVGVLRKLDSPRVRLGGPASQPTFLRGVPDRLPERGLGRPGRSGSDGSCRNLRTHSAGSRRGAFRPGHLLLDGGKPQGDLGACNS